MLLEEAFVATVEHAERKECHAPALPDAALHKCDDFQPELDLKERESQRRDRYDAKHGIGLEPSAATVEHLGNDNEHDAHHEQSAEKPKRTCQKLVVAAHRKHDVGEPLQSHLKGIGMSDSALPVAVGLIEDAYLEQHIVNEQEKHAPLDERHIQPLQSLHAETPWCVQMLAREEIACRDEKQRHVEEVDELQQQVRALGVAKHHENYGYALAYRDADIALGCCDCRCHWLHESVVVLCVARIRHKMGNG